MSQSQKETRVGKKIHSAVRFHAFLYGWSTPMGWVQGVQKIKPSIPKGSDMGHVKKTNRECLHLSYIYFTAFVEYSGYTATLRTLGGSGTSKINLIRLGHVSRYGGYLGFVLPTV